MARVKLQITLPEEIKERVIDQAKDNDITVSLWIELIIKKQLEKAKKEGPVIDLGI